MPGEYEAIEGWRGKMVVVGMATPASRAFCAGTAAAALMFACGVPSQAYKRDGSLAPPTQLSTDPQATGTHFIFYPVLIAATVYCFT
jgi:hypothetical protein